METRALYLKSSVSENFQEVGMGSVRNADNKALSDDGVGADSARRITSPDSESMIYARPELSFLITLDEDDDFCPF
jgi:hypothetical protein